MNKALLVIEMKTGPLRFMHKNFDSFKPLKYRELFQASIVGGLQEDGTVVIVKCRSGEFKPDQILVREEWDKVEFLENL